MQYSVPHRTVENAYRDGQQLVLQPQVSLPDVCINCGNSAYGNIVHKKFPDQRYLWVLPTPLALLAGILYLFMDRYLFDFPFCANCSPGFPLTAVRIDENLAVFNGANARFLDALPPITPAVASEKNREWIDRKLGRK